MFDLTKATPQQRYTYSQLSPSEQKLVDGGFVSIDQYADVFEPQSKPVTSPVPLPAAGVSASQEGVPTSTLGAMGQAAKSSMQQFTGQTGRLAADAMGGFSGDRTVHDVLNALTGGKVIEQMGKESAKGVKQYREQEGLGEGFDGGIRGIAIDAAQNPDSLAGLAGGILTKTGVGAPAGVALTAIPTGRVALAKYYELLDNGVPQKEAAARATAEGAIEFGTEQIPMGEIGQRVLGGTGKRIVTGAVEKIVKGAAMEGTEEMIAEVGQSGLDNLISATGAGSDALQESAEHNKFKSLEDAIKRIGYSGTVGAVMGGGLRGVTAYHEGQAERRDFASRAAAMLEAGANAADGMAEVSGKVGLEETGSKNESILTPEEIKAQTEKAFTDREAQKPAEEQAIRDAAFEQKALEDYAAAHPDNIMAQQLAKAGAGKALGTPVQKTELKDPDEALLKEAEAAKLAAEEVRKKEAKSLEAAKKKAVTKARKVHVAERTKEQVRLGKLVLDKELDAKGYAEGMKKWNKENPLPSDKEIHARVEEAATSKGQKVTGKKASAKDKLAQSVLKSEDEVELTPEELKAQKEALRAKVAPIVAKAATPTKAEAAKTNEEKNRDYLLKQSKSMSPREINSLYAGIESGRMEIKDADSDTNFVPDKDGKSADAYYDGKKMVINRNSKKSVMELAAHEVDHHFKHADKLDGDEVKRYLAGKHNVDPVIMKIEKLATSGNMVAKRAKSLAVSAVGNSPKLSEAAKKQLYKEELVAHFHQQAQKASKTGVLGSARSAVADLHSAFKDKILGKLDEVEDSPYISRKRLETAKQADNTSKKTIHLESFGGVQGRGFRAAKERGGIFEGSDKQFRYYIPDEEAFMDMQAWSDADEGQKVNLDKMLRHEKLFEEYPAARRIKVIKYYDKEKTASGYLGADGNVYINEATAIGRSNIERTILHEVQHWIQDKEGFEKGSSPVHEENLMKARIFNEKLMPALKDSENLDTLEAFIAKRYGYEDFGEVIQEASERPDSAMASVAGFMGKLRDPNSKKGVRAAGMRFFINNGLMSSYIEGPIGRAMWEMENIDTEKAYDNYLDRSGEREARAVEEMFDARSASQFNTNKLDEDKYGKAMYKMHVQRPGERLGDKGEDPVEPQSFRSKGEGEIYPQSYEDWTEWLTGESEASINSLRDALNSGKLPRGGMGPVEMEADITYYEWAKKASKRYLDKYAGTSEDPLKDLVLPDGDRWEDLMDQHVIKKAGVEGKPLFFPAGKGDGGAFGEQGEIVYPEGGVNLITQYLNHVEDTMRERLNRGDIKYEDLSKYDLVRAIKETHALDAKKLRDAEKARAKKDANLTVVREYEDGTKWVKLDKPGQFARESDIMGHSVRGYEPPPKRSRIESAWDDSEAVAASGAHPDWIPESGDSGHEYYGHGGWEAIKRGEAQVFSLRDKDGRSHVTVEAHSQVPSPAEWYHDHLPEDSPARREVGKALDKTKYRAITQKIHSDISLVAKTLLREERQQIFDKTLAEHPLYEEFAKTKKTDITQIKGKGNMKPSDKWVPYVQDFVLNEGPWAQVDDYYNADLRKVGNKMFTADQVARATEPMLAEWSKQNHGLRNTSIENYASMTSEFLKRNPDIFDGEDLGLPKVKEKKDPGVLFSRSDDDVIETPAFKNWFKKSKVVDSEGKPLVVYTGTSKDVDFKAFRAPRNGVWFTKDRGAASQYAVENDSMETKTKDWRTFYDVNTASRVMPVYLSLQNPKVLNDGEWPENLKYAENYKRAQGIYFDQLKAEGYDGLIFGDVYVAFEPQQIKSAIGNNGNFDPNKAGFLLSRDLPEEDEQSPAAKLAKSLWGGFKGMFSTAGMGGRKLREIMESAAGTAIEYQLVAEAHFTDLSKALAEAERENPGYDWINFWKRLEGEESAEQRERMVTAMGRDYPEVARSYRLFRDTIDNFTDLLVAHYIQTRGFDNLTEKEINTLNKMVDNKGRYNTRSYLLSKGKSGDLYGKLSWKQFVKGNEDEDSIPDNQRRAYERVKEALEYFDRALDIPETLPTNLANLRDLYRAWFSVKGNETPDEMREKLRQKRAVLTKADVQRNSANTVKQILGVMPMEKGKYAEFVRGEELDTTIMQTRKDVPKAIRKLMGEVDDNIPLKMQMTVVAQANYVANSMKMAEIAMHEDLARSPEAKNEDREDNKNFTVQLKGEPYGPLQDYWVTPGVARLLQQQKTVNASFINALKLIMASNAREGGRELGNALWDVWGGLANYTKAMVTVGNPFGYLWNVAGNVLNLTRQGNINYKYMIKAMHVASQMVGSKSLRTVSDTTRMMNRMQMLDSAQVGELKTEAMDILRDEVYAQTDPDNKTYKAKRAIRRVAGTAREVYAMTDVVGKIANALYMMDQMREYHELNGDEVTEAELEREVADYIKDDNITFSRAAPILKAVEGRGLTRFATYIGETFRTQAWNLQHAYNELQMAKNAKTPAARNKALEMAGRRMMGTLAMVAMATALLEAISKSGDDKEEAWKRFLPDFARIGHPLFMGRDKDGNSMFLTLNRVDPVGPVLDLLRAAQSGKIKDMEDVLDQIKDLYIPPMLVRDAWKLAFTAKTQADKRKALKAVMLQVLPAGISNQFKYDYPVGDDAKSHLGQVIRFMGGRLDVAKPQQSLNFAARDFEDIQRTGRNDLFDELANAKVEQFIDTLNKHEYKEAKAFGKLVEMDQALVKIGRTPGQRRTMLKDAGLSAEVVTMVMKGQSLYGTRTTLLSEKSVAAYVRTSKINQGPTKGKEIETNVNANKAKLKKLGYKFK